MKLNYIVYFLSIFCLVAYTNCLKAQGTLSAGTLIVVKPDKIWDSRENNAPSFVVACPIKDNSGNLVINAGAIVDLSADWIKNKGVGKPGKVEIQFQSVRDVNGSLIPINGYHSDEGGNRKGLAHGLTWGLFFSGLGPLSLPCLAIKGEPAEIRNYLTVNTYTIQ